MIKWPWMPLSSVHCDYWYTLTFHKGKTMYGRARKLHWSNSPDKWNIDVGRVDICISVMLFSSFSNSKWWAEGVDIMTFFRALYYKTCYVPLLKVLFTSYSRKFKSKQHYPTSSYLSYVTVWDFHPQNDVTSVNNCPTNTCA